MKELVAQQRQFFNSHTTKDISFRIKQLTSLEDVLNDNIELLDRAVFNDFKKSSFENYMTEIGIVLYDIKQAKKKLTRWSSKQRVKTNLGNFPAKSYIIPEPLGVTLIISSWNYPYQLSLAPIVAAIAAGNTIILKPSEISSQTSSVMASILNEAFDPNFLKVIQGGVQETTELLKQKFDKIFFTGSTTVGKIIYKAAAEHLTPVTLELGGKSPVIITKDANIKMVAKRTKDVNHFLYLGRGINFPVALEGALKLKEISYIHAEGYPAAEMKHGPIALIDENMPVIFLAPKDNTFLKILANIQ